MDTVTSIVAQGRKEALLKALGVTWREHVKAASMVDIHDLFKIWELRNDCGKSKTIGFAFQELFSGP